MKKRISVIALALAVLLSLTACNFFSDHVDMAGGETETQAMVADMMAALAEERLEDAKKLMHPSVVEKSDDPIGQMAAFLAGRKAVSMQRLEINVHSSSGTGGKVRQENAAYQVTLDDGTQIYVAMMHLSDNAGEGFSSFQIAIGVV